MQENEHKGSVTNIVSAIRSRLGVHDAANAGAASGTAANEDERLRDVWNLELLDTDADERFDRITRIAARVFDAPVALITLIERDRVWFKSRHGLAHSESPRHTSFGQYTITQDGILVLEDLRRDPRFRNHALVTGEPHYRFYAGATLHGAGGLPVGTLCILGHEPRSLDSAERAMLAELASWVEDEFALSRTLRSNEQQVADLSGRDPVLPNAARTIAEERLDRLFVDTLSGTQTLGVLHLEVTNLHEIERVYTPQVLQQKISAWLETLRSGECGITCLTRLSDTEFIGAIRREGTEESIRRRCEAHLKAATRTMRSDNASVAFHVLAGMSIHPAHGATSAELIEKARIAHREQSVNGGVAMFCPELEERLSREAYIRRNLGNAIADGSLHFHWQPLFNNQNLTLHGFELLARWLDDDIGWIYPDEFIPISESDETLRRTLVCEALETACRQIAAWSHNDPETTPYVSVNIPGAEFFEPDFCDLVAGILDRNGIGGQRLILELTERSLIADFDVTAAAMARLNRLDIRMAMDDFGSGYSSIAYLTRLPLSIVKLDKSVVQRLEFDIGARKLMRGIVELAHGQNLKVVAEGVETKAQFKMVQFVGCEYTQGFLLGRPQPQTAAEQLVANRAAPVRNAGYS